MERRPLLNARDESHAERRLARLHIIYFDMVLSPIANWLKAGTTQLVVALCEAGLVEPGSVLDDPVECASAISRDLSLRQTFATAARRRRLTAIEIQQKLLDLAAELVATGLVSQAVPRADEILRTWQEALDLLRHRDIDRLAQRFDNWLKYVLLERYRGRRSPASDSPELKLLDRRHGNLDPELGLFWQMARDGSIEKWPVEEEIERFVAQPPEDTRAWLRGKVLQRHGCDVSDLDWSWIEFRIPTHRGWWSVARLAMEDPSHYTRADCESVFQQTRSVDELVESLTPDHAAAGEPPAAPSFYLRNGHDRGD
jgi:proteasome accessory factor A